MNVGVYTAAAFRLLPSLSNLLRSYQKTENSLSCLKTIEDAIDEQRANLQATGAAGTPITEITFNLWIISHSQPCLPRARDSSAS